MSMRTDAVRASVAEYANILVHICFQIVGLSRTSNVLDLHPNKFVASQEQTETT